MDKTITYEGKKLFYRISGEGSPVILVHGFGEDGTVWDVQVNDLKNHFRLIVPDLPGSGQSEIIEDMSIDGLAEAVHAIIHEEKIDASPVIGHSMGGYVALALLEKYPNHLNSLGLFHSTAYADNEEKKEARRKGIGFIREHGAFEFLKTSIPNLFSPQSRDQEPKRIGEFIEKQHNFSPQALVFYYEAMMQRPDRTRLFKMQSIPFLFIMGKYDNAVPLNDGLEQCHMPERSYIHILRNTGHMGMMEEPETANRILKEFLMNA